MPETAENILKFNNYKEQMSRLSRALNSHFYLEAVFIEYAILEDRLESVLRHSGKWRPKQDEIVSIYKKVKLVEKLAEQENSLAGKYFRPELLRSILLWKDDRNTMIHALLKQNVHTEDLQSIAEKGQTIVRTLCDKTRSYNRAMDRLAEKEK